MTVHYVRYHKVGPENPINSHSGSFEAWADIRAKQPSWRPPVKSGDVVWLLSGTDTGGRNMVYRLEYFFVASGKPIEEEGRFVIRGKEGKLFDPCPVISRETWFSEFFNAIGHGGTSFQRIPEKYLSYFHSVMDETLATTDRAESVLSGVEKSGQVEDEIQLRAIMSRRGQPEFRQKLLMAYEGKCCITGCDVKDVLEAAHIKSHAEEQDYSTTNGLLLRTDIHTLFDLHLIGIDQFDRIRVSKSLKKSDYEKLDGQRIRLPASLADRPSYIELSKRLEKLTQLDAAQ